MQLILRVYHKSLLDKYIKLSTKVVPEQRQFESEFGFKSPGFSVDALGNITATSGNARRRR